MNDNLKNLNQNKLRVRFYVYSNYIRILRYLIWVWSDSFHLYSSRCDVAIYIYIYLQLPVTNGTKTELNETIEMFCHGQVSVATYIIKIRSNIENRFYTDDCNRDAIWYVIQEAHLRAPVSACTWLLWISKLYFLVIHLSLILWWWFIFLFRDRYQMFIFMVHGYNVDKTINLNSKSSALHENSEDLNYIPTKSWYDSTNDGFLNSQRFINDISQCDILLFRPLYYHTQLNPRWYT